MSRARWASGGLGGLAALGLLVGWLALGPAGSDPAEPAVDLPPPPELLAIPPPRPIDPRPAAAVWATVRRAGIVRAAPDPGAPSVAGIDRLTPEETTNVVEVLGRRRGGDGQLWVRARVAALPNGTVGWVPRTLLGSPQEAHERVVVDLDRLTLTVSRRGERIFRAPIGVGATETPTPRGRFVIRNRLTSFRSPFYGPLAFGTSARSAVLTDWPAGGFVGIHGTNRPEILPGRISHGCIRLRNPDLLRLARLMPIGTPVEII